MKEFLGFGGYAREAEGYLSAEHLTFVTSLVVMMIALAVWLGRRNRKADHRRKNKVLIWSALLIDGFEIFKLVIFCLRSGEATSLINNLPLFLCSIQLITIPLAAFSKGRIKEASLDFVCIFGLLLMVQVKTMLLILCCHWIMWYPASHTASPDLRPCISSYPEWSA